MVWCRVVPKQLAMAPQRWDVIEHHYQKRCQMVPVAAHIRISFLILGKHRNPLLGMWLVCASQCVSYSTARDVASVCLTVCQLLHC